MSQVLPKYHVIFSMDSYGVIGCFDNGMSSGHRKDDLVYRSSTDLKRFRYLTSKKLTPHDPDNVVVMGKNTWNSLNGKTLQGRQHIILTHSKREDIKDCTFVSSWIDVFRTIQNLCPKNVFIIGGKHVILSFMEKYRYLVTSIYVTVFEREMQFEKNGYSLISFSQEEHEKIMTSFSIDDVFQTHDLVKVHGHHDEVLTHVAFQTWKPRWKQQDMKGYEEYQYLEAMQKILFSPRIQTRNGIVQGVFGLRFVYDLSDGTVPALTTKKVAWKTCIKELLWFLRGDTNNKILKEQGVHIWDGNASRDFLDSRGLTSYEEDDLGPVYGFQWRHSGATYKDCHTDYHGCGVDQIENVIQLLKNDPHSRRILVNSWNVSNLNEMALPPCHILFQFYVSSDNRLWLQFYQRSADMFLGVPFNILSYAVLLHLVCFKTGYKPGGMIHCIGDAHIYTDHEKAVMTQLERTPYAFPKLRINLDAPKKNWKEYTIDDFALIDYKSHDKIFAPMNV